MGLIAVTALELLLGTLMGVSDPLHCIFARVKCVFGTKSQRIRFPS